MRILQVFNFFSLPHGGGTVAVIYQLSRAMTQRGHEVTIYTSDFELDREYINSLEGVEVYPFHSWLNLPRFYFYLTIGMIWEAKRKVKDFEIIHMHGYRSLQNIVIHHYAKKYNIPYVLQAHGSVLPFFQKQRLKNIFDLFFGYSILRDASKVIASTKIEARQYKKMSVDKDKIEIVPNGIDLSEYDNLPKRGKFRKKYKIKDEEKMILYLGRIHKIKGIDLLVEAFSDLIRELKDVRLVIVGSDDGFLSMLKRQIDDLKIGDKILFTGLIPEKDKLRAYVDADVYVLPSVYETFPVTVLEACACGTPVIVTDRCGIANIVNDNNVGHVVEYNKDQLQDAIFKILTNVELRCCFGEGGKKLVREKFSWDIVVEQLEQIYGDIICS